MCTEPEQLNEPAEAAPSGIGRRGFLRGVAAGGVALAGAAVIAPAAAASAPDRGMTAVLLGTQAGPPPVADRAGIASAVVVDGATYVVDCGRNAVSQYQRAGLRYADLAGIFLTHLHADHVADYYNFFQLAGLSGAGTDVIPDPLQVYGPPSAGQLPPAAGGAPVPTVAPADPVPGTRAMTEHLHAAFAYSSNVYLRENPAATRSIEELAQVHEVAVPAVGSSPVGEPAPPMRPFVVMEDDRVRVSAILVPHGNVYPAFAFRFDSDHGSVTFSGDTRLSDNVVTLARGSDLLVHEAISLPASGVPAQFRDAMLADHTLVDQVGSVAQRAEVPHLVLSHVIDFGGRLSVGDWSRRAKTGYDGKVTIGEDLARFPARTRASR